MSNNQPSDLERILEKFRRELLRNERKAASALVRVYGEAWKRIKAELERLHTEYEVAKARGEEPGADWIYQYNRARAFRDQVERELLRFAQYAEASTREQMQEAIRAAEEHAEKLVRTALGKPPAGLVVDWNRVPTAAVAEMVGLTQPDSPLHKLFVSVSAEGAHVAEDAIVQGLLMGKNPRETAPLLRKALGATLSRALRIARTETLRAYREATRQSYQANSDIVTGWVWHCALDERTCAACWAMHGTEHRLDERLDDHPNGRCAMVPKTASWAEIGKKYGIDLSDVPDTNPPIESGVSVFVKLPAEKQIKILGPAKYAAWKNDHLTLSELVGRKRSAVWGTHRYEKSLAELGLDARKFYALPKRKVFGLDRDQLVDLGKTIDVELERILGGEQRWSGRIIIRSASTLPDAFGVKEWNCDIYLRDDAEPRVLVHELLHGRSKGLTRYAYQNNKGVEEGVVEKLARMYGPEVLHKLGFTFGKHDAYDHYINALEKIRNRIKMDEEKFYKQLYNIELAKRRYFLIQAAGDEVWVYDILNYDLDVR